MKIALGSDHGGLELKRKVFEFLKSKNYECTDCGTYDDKSVPTCLIHIVQLNV